MQIDLDDLPPKVARLFSGLTENDEIALVQGGGLVCRLRVFHAGLTQGPLDDLPADEAMEEVLDHFKSMIEEEF